MTWVIYHNPDEQETALQLARGSYQRNLLLGYEAWSGSTLKGKAKKWSGQYSRSRESLLSRLYRAGLEVTFQTINRRKVLVVGSDRPSDWERLVQIDV